MEVDTVCRIEVNADECTGCGICLGSCKREALAIGSAVNRFGIYPVQHSSANCRGCATCYYLCPEPGAINLLN
jgi:2-oxoglutarate ferredoxin oxidoreductase subunit delta